MLNRLRPAFSVLLLFTVLISTVRIAAPCGPADLVPVFTNDKAPDYPFTDYADGKLGIVKPGFPRMVLFAAYRYMNGSNFSAYEREGLVAAWKEFYDRGPGNHEGVSEAIKDWISERSSVVENEETPPDIYAERQYEDISYDFFPNCSKDAFIVARDTLSDRAAMHGSSDPWVQEWIKGQDTVFRNCSDTKASPAAVNASMPEWLQKDRAYQIAAAEFYALDYERAKTLFREIANDPDSPWQEVAEYLIPRTIVRQASLSKNKDKNSELYTEVEQRLESIYAGSGKYSDAAERLIGLIKYRTKPEQRVQELAQNLMFYGGDNLKQDLIDFTWLMDKFETQALNAEEKRREQAFRNSPEGRAAANAARKAEEAAIAAAEAAADAAANSNSVSVDADSEVPDRIARMRDAAEKGLVTIYIYSDDYLQSWTIFVEADATDEEVLAEAERVAGPLTDSMRQRIREQRRTAYQGRFNDRESDYEGGYYGDVETSLSILPPFLLSSELTEWLITFQIQSEEAYLHSLNRYRQTNSDAWLIAAISKAGPGSRELTSLMEAAQRVAPNSPAFPTAAYHRARILLALGLKPNAKRVLDEVLGSSIDLPISTRNEFAELRMTLADSLEDFLRHSLRRPYAFEFVNDYMSVDQIIALRKSYWSPEYDEQTKEDFEREVEEELAYAKSIENELMLDQDSIEIINFHFPVALMKDVQRSPLLPEYLRGRFAMAVWTKAVLLGDFKTAAETAPEVARFHPEMRETMTRFMEARTDGERKIAALFAILKNERVTPFIASGFGTPTESLSYSSRWWCETFPTVWSDEKEELVPITIKDRPLFITASQSETALAEMKKISELGNAPAFIARAVQEWAASSPRDPRVPEALYIAWDANGWDKYGCEGDMVMREKLRNLLVTKYPSSSWAQKVIADENGDT